MGGWAVLPSAQYIPTPVLFPIWILPVSLPTIYFFTKASVLAFTAVLGVLLFHRRSLVRLDWRLWDLPVIVWCLVPLVSGFANEQSAGDACRASLYQSLCWGVPYLCGRLFFRDPGSQRLLARAFVAAGLAYVPICLVEIVLGPQFYAHIYGYQAYRWVGAPRYVGYRPVGLLEDGNQLGIWMATAALIALGMWQRDRLERVFGVPIHWAAAVLVAVTIFCQSAGSILLLAALCPLVLFRKSAFPRVLAVALVSAILLFVTLRLANVASFRGLSETNDWVASASEILKKTHRSSLRWRLLQDDKYVVVALRHPLVGSSRWDWWKGGPARPWGLWLLAFGMYGSIGLVSLECFLLLPALRGTVLWKSVRGESGTWGPVLAAAILMSATDSLLNGAVILPLLLVNGALSNKVLANKASKDEFRRIPD